MSTTNYLYNIFVVNDGFENGDYFDPDLYHNRNFTLQRENYLGSELASDFVATSWPNFVDPADVQRTLKSGVSNSGLHAFKA
jgi:hypothetical protein